MAAAHARRSRAAGSSAVLRNGHGPRHRAAACPRRPFGDTAMRLLRIVGRGLLSIAVILVTLALSYLLIQSGLGAYYEEDQRHANRCHEQPWLTICGAQP